MKKSRKWLFFGAIILFVSLFVFFYNESPRKEMEESPPVVETIQTALPNDMESAQTSDVLVISEKAVNKTQDVVNIAEQQQKEQVTGEKKENVENQIVEKKIVEKKNEEIEKEDAENPPLQIQIAETKEGEKQNFCTLSISCKTILSNMNSLDSAKCSIIPTNGVIFPESKIEFHEGESVFDVLQRSMKNAGIHLEFTNTPIYRSVYIEGIANIYEYDCGELSGWMYSVNDAFPKMGCSSYILKNGDKIEWFYTCDLGKDVGNPKVVGD